MVIVGDTPADIACGRRHGAKTVAVATGAFDVEALGRHGPDHVLAHLGDVAALLRAIESP